MKISAFWVCIVLLFLAGLGLTHFSVNPYYFNALYVILQATIMAVAWNILGGFTGYVNFGSAAFFAVGAYTSIALDKALGLPLPLSAVQILYVNLATDGLPALALSVDPPEKDLMRRKPRNPRTGVFTRPVITLMTVGGLWSALVNLGLFAWALSSGRSIEEAMTMTFVSLVLIQFFKAYNFRSDRNSVLNRPFANKWLNLAIVWEALLLILIIYLPFLHDAFGTFYLPLVDWLIVIGLAFTVSPVLELAKWMERRGWFGKMA